MRIKKYIRLVLIPILLCVLCIIIIHCIGNTKSATPSATIETNRIDTETLSVKLNIVDPGLGDYLIYPSIYDDKLLLTPHSVLDSSSEDGLVSIYNIKTGELTETGIRSQHPEIVKDCIYYFEYDHETQLSKPYLYKYDINKGESEIIHVCDHSPFVSLYADDKYLAWYEELPDRPVIRGQYDEVYGIKCRQIIFSLDTMQVYKTFDDYIYFPTVHPLIADEIISVKEYRNGNFTLKLIDLDTEDLLMAIRIFKTPSHIAFNSSYLAFKLNGYNYEIYSVPEKKKLYDVSSPYFGCRIYGGLMLTSDNGNLIVRDIESDKTIFTTEEKHNEMLNETDRSYRYNYGGYMSANENVFVSRRVDKLREGYTDIYIIEIEN